MPQPVQQDYMILLQDRTIVAVVNYFAIMVMLLICLCAFMIE